MNFHSLLFAGTPPIAVHMRWEEGPEEKSPANHRLWIFTDRKKAEDFYKCLSEEEAAAFKRIVRSLGEGVEPARCEFEGGIAQLLKDFLSDYYAVQEQHFLGLSPCTLCGFWDPPEEGPPGYGLILWIDNQDSGSHALIACKDHARQTLRNLPWLGPRQKHLQRRINEWNAQERGPKMIHFEGPVARLLCDASLYFKVEEALHSRGVRMAPRAK